MSSWRLKLRLCSTQAAALRPGPAARPAWRCWELGMWLVPSGSGIIPSSELLPPGDFGAGVPRNTQPCLFLPCGLADDRMALVSGISLDPEAAIGVTKRSPPKWVDGVDEIQYDVGRIKQKMKELASLHDQHLNRPTLDDSSEQEHAIEITTQEITQLFHRCQRAVQALPSRARRACSEQEERLLRNVVASLAQALQELSTGFRLAQSGYLKRMKNREERSQHFFATSVPLMDDGDDNTLYDRGFTDDQLVLVEQNTLMVEEREREIRQIVQSISDLNEIFRDLGAMIVEQGTVLDRIDYHVEQSCIKTEDGLKQLHKVLRYTSF
nr:syntaxin-16 isoform X1 [Vicugna pacos]